MDGEIRRIPNEEIKVGEEQYFCCEVCGGTQQSWRYQDQALNDEDGRPRPTHSIQVAGFSISYQEAPTECYYNCHPQAKSKVATRDVTRIQVGHVEVRCCGEWLWCDRFTNTCDKCGADYNMSGHQLANREQWGEETGETVADILSADSDFPELD